MWQATVDLQRAHPHEDAAAEGVVLKFLAYCDSRSPRPADAALEVSASAAEGVQERRVNVEKLEMIYHHR